MMDDPALIQAKIQRLLIESPEPMGFEYIADCIHRFLRQRDEIACRDLIIVSRLFVSLLNNPVFSPKLRDFYECEASNELLTDITKNCFTNYPATRIGSPISDAQNAQTLVSLPLGIQKAYAREHVRNHHEALLHTPWPQVVEILVQNSSIQERDILRMSSRKPTQNDLLEPILASNWTSRAEVRFALAANPCLNASHAMRLALSLPSSKLELLSELPELHISIRVFAQKLLDYSHS